MAYAILAALGFGWVMENILDYNRVYGVVAGGVFLIIAAVLVLQVKDKTDPSLQKG